MFWKTTKTIELGFFIRFNEREINSNFARMSTDSSPFDCLSSISRVSIVVCTKQARFLCDENARIRFCLLLREKWTKSLPSNKQKRQKVKGLEIYYYYQCDQKKLNEFGNK